MNDEKLICPVCDRPNIEGDICPNCETNLSLVRMLMELPAQEENLNSPKSSFWRFYTKKITSFNWLAVGLAILLIIIGISLGFTANFFFLSTNATFTPNAFSFSSNVSLVVCE